VTAETGHVSVRFQAEGPAPHRHRSRAATPVPCVQPARRQGAHQLQRAQRASAVSFSESLTRAGAQSSTRGATPRPCATRLAGGHR
jgi:hypothetical protein